MSIILLIIAGCLFFFLGIPVVISLIYGCIYRGIINRRIQEFNRTGVVRNSPVSPNRFFLIVIAISILGLLPPFFILATVGVFRVSKDNLTEMYGGSLDADYEFRTEFAQAGTDDPLEGISPEQDINGYTRYETTDGNYRFIYYINNNGIYSPFPELLLYAEYTGDAADSIEYGAVFSNDETYEYESCGYIEQNNGSWFVSDTQNFIGILQFELSATDEQESHSDQDVDFAETDNTGVLELDYGELFYNNEQSSSSTSDTIRDYFPVLIP